MLLVAADRQFVGVSTKDSFDGVSFGGIIGLW